LTGNLLLILLTDLQMKKFIGNRNYKLMTKLNVGYIIENIRQ